MDVESKGKEKEIVLIEGEEVNGFEMIKEGIEEVQKEYIEE